MAEQATLPATADYVPNTHSTLAEAFSPISPATLQTPDASSATSVLNLLQPIVHFDEISIEEKVGHGSYGVVYRGIWRNRFVAVKEFIATTTQTAIETEVKQLSRVRHKNIISLFGISSYQQSIYLIMEYAEGGSLHSFLHGNVQPYYSTAHAMSWAHQCAEGVAYLHAMKPKPLIHRDLKPLNLLLTNKGRNLKICDFGTVADKSTLMTNNKGSAAWMAPEVFVGKKYSEKCDIFSWGIVFWEVLSREQPFKCIDNTAAIMWKIYKGIRPDLMENCPKPIANLITSCWASDPDDRPSMQYVVNVMNELVLSFPGAEEPLEYKFENQQIILTDLRGESNNYVTDFSTFHASVDQNTSTQLTPTNLYCHSDTSSSITPTNSDIPDKLTPHNDMPTASIIRTSLWDAIPEETESSVMDSFSSNDTNAANSAAAVKRSERIRNEMTQMASVPMAPLVIEVDPRAWDLNLSDGFNFAKSDGKERLTVTDAKPIMQNLNTTDSDVVTSNNTANDNNNQPSDDCDSFYVDPNADEDDDDNETNDQFLAEMLDPELQPEKPNANYSESLQVFRDHKRLIKDYLRLDTKLYYERAKKENLLMQMSADEKQKKLEVLKLVNEKEDLLELFNNLKQQSLSMGISNIGNLSGAYSNNSTTNLNLQQNEIMADDGWVVIAPNQNT